MKKSSILAASAALILSGCAPQAIFFHEATKVAFTADYNTSDSQPIQSSFGFKRRIVAVVPAQERFPVDGNSLHDQNKGDAVSLVSKFHVRVGTFSEGVRITNQFASGLAAEKLTASRDAAAAVNTVLHSEPVVTETMNGAPVDEGATAAQRVNARLARIASKRLSVTDGGSSRGKVHSPRVDSAPHETTDLPVGHSDKTTTDDSGRLAPTAGGTSRGKVTRGAGGVGVRSTAPTPTPADASGN
jgi:hypothetical protein